MALRCVPWPTFAAAAEPTTVTVASRELKPGRSGGRIVAGEAPEAVAETVRLLAEEAKVSLARRSFASNVRAGF